MLVSISFRDINLIAAMKIATFVAFARLISNIDYRKKISFYHIKAHLYIDIFILQSVYFMELR